MNLERELRYMEYVQRETGTRHQSLEEDLLPYELLKAGDMRAADAMKEIFDHGLPGKTSDDPLRNAKYLFGNSFELVEDVLNINSVNYKQFLGKIIHTKFPTKLLNEFSKKMQSIPRLTEYQIEAMNPHKNDDKFTLKLKNTTLGTYFYIDMLLDEHLAQDQSEYFGYIFALGPGKKIETSEGSRAMMRAGHVGIGFTEDETMMAAGEPDRVINGENGLYTWVYQRSNNKLLYVDFNGSGVVTKTYTRDNNAKPGGGAATSRHSSSAARQAARSSMGWGGKGTPIE